MSFFRTVDPAEPAVFEGEAGFSAIAEASRDVMLYADNFNARAHGQSEGFERAIEAIRDETGIELRNPHLDPQSHWINRMPRDEDPFKVWDRRIEEIIEQHPDKAEIFRPFMMEGITDYAKGRARETSDRYEGLAATRDDWTGFGAGIYGGFKGALRDPATLATLPFGLGAGGARTLAGKVLSTAWREALVTGTTEAAIQPFVQKWRAEAGLPAGLEEAARNVGLATALGGVIGAGVRGAVELPGTIRRQLSRRPDPRLQAPGPEKIVDDLNPVRDDLSPATRAAVDVVDQERAVSSSIRSEFGDDFGADLVQAMEGAERFTDLIDQPLPDRFVPQGAPRRTVTRPPSLTEFLAKGGLKDEGGELAAMDLDKLAIPGSGRLVRKEGGVPLDRAREAAAEAGYIHGYGGREAAMANSTVDDLLAALREEQAGNRVYALGDDTQALRWREEGEAIEAHQAREVARREIYEISGGRLTPDESARAMRLVDGGMDPDEAVERVFLYEDTSPLEGRIEPFEPDSTEYSAQVDGLENQIDLDAEIVDLLSVDDKGRIIANGRTVGEALEEADRGLFLSEIVEACRPA
ncbi:MAG: hypothetical protein JJ856_14250 [Roseibium sp.]|uniref:hypothetical protein n=2 Tax=Roseibium sp. TaxID=1936156 RepID=UPI001B0BFACF|nr:hypothetical protein [Roseibium sp.]MBO6930732.1 hypothetical protein [Roseibium sp.]